MSFEGRIVVNTRPKSSYVTPPPTKITVYRLALKYWSKFQVVSLISIRNDEMHPTCLT